MDGMHMSCLLTIDHVVKTGYLWTGCLVYKQWTTLLKEGTYGWVALFINNESRG